MPGVLTQVVKVTSPTCTLIFFTLGEKFFEWGLGGEAPQKNFTILDAVFQIFPSENVPIILNEINNVIFV